MNSPSESKRERNESGKAGEPSRVSGRVVARRQGEMSMDVDEYHLEYLRSVSAHCTVSKHRVMMSESLVEPDFKTIGDGIVFVHAAWSAQSIVALRTISKILNEQRFDGIRLFVVCCDKVDVRREIFGNIRFGGYGETFWIKKGQIVYTGSDYRESDLAELIAATEAVLA